MIYNQCQCCNDHRISYGLTLTIATATRSLICEKLVKVSQSVSLSLSLFSSKHLSSKPLKIYRNVFSQVSEKGAKTKAALRPSLFKKFGGHHVISGPWLAAWLSLPLAIPITIKTCQNPSGKIIPARLCMN